jgi:nucleotide-binding universal stress UspA family protein
MAIRPVLVGVDGSSTSMAALAHAAWQAARRGLALHVVAGHGPGQAARREAEDLVARASATAPTVTISGEAVAGRAATTLVRLSADAALTVVGSRGRNGLPGLLLGSVSTHLAAHSRSPVIVIRPAAGPADPYASPELTVVELSAAPPPWPVVVGIDDIPDSQAAIDFAMDEAAARGSTLVVLYAWWMPPVARLGPVGARPPRTPLPPADQDAREADVKAMLAEATAAARARHPEVPVDLRPIHALNPALALLDASTDAGLLVVSRHGGNVLTRRLFSSIGDTAVREAPCPAAVVPASPVPVSSAVDAERV